MSSRNPYTCLGQGLVPMCPSEWPYSQECLGVHCSCVEEKRSRIREPACAKAGPTFCRCGAPRIPTLNHLFITEDLTKVPSRFKYEEGKYRSVRVGGRTYFLLRSDIIEPLWTDAQYHPSRRSHVTDATGRGVDKFVCKHDLEEDLPSRSHHSEIRSLDRKMVENMRSFNGPSHMRKVDNLSHKETHAPLKEQRQISRSGSGRRFNSSAVPRQGRFRTFTGRSRVDHRPIPRATKSLVNSVLPSYRVQSRSGRSKRAESQSRAGQPESHDRSIRCTAQKQGRERKANHVDCWRPSLKNESRARVTSSLHKASASHKEDQDYRRPRRNVCSKGRPRPRLTNTADEEEGTKNSINKMNCNKQSDKSLNVAPRTKDRKNLKMATNNVVGDKSDVKNEAGVLDDARLEAPLATDGSPSDIEKTNNDSNSSAISRSNEVVCEVKLLESSGIRMPNRVAGGEGDAGHCASPLK